jgi:hypothetical protein
MARAKRAQVTTMESPAKPAPSTAADKKNGHAGMDLEGAIRSRAYELYERRGRHDGFAQDDWLKAEAEVTSRVSRTA